MTAQRSFASVCMTGRGLFHGLLAWYRSQKSQLLDNARSMNSEKMNPLDVTVL